MVLGSLMRGTLLYSPLLQRLAECFLYNSEIMLDDWISYRTYLEVSWSLRIHGNYFRPEVTHFLTDFILFNTS